MDYRNGVWRPALDLDLDVQQHLGEEVREGRVKETLGALTRDAPRRAWFDWNHRRRLINCANGMLDPVDLKFVPHRPEYWSTFQIPVAWNPDAEGERLDRFLHELLPAEDVEFALEMVGYLATCDISIKHFFVLEGEANTGKTAFLSLVTALLGEQNVAVVGLQDLAQNRFALAQLENKLLATFDDLDDRALRSSSILKALTGSYPMVRVERKGRDAYTAPLYARMLYTCNRMPDCATDRSDAWQQRPIIIPFERVLPPERQNPYLPETLKRPEVLERLLRRAAEGLQTLVRQRMRFRMTESISCAVARYCRSTDNISAFVDECCTLGTGTHLKKSRFYTAYTDWCRGEGLAPLGRNTAYARLLQLGGIADSKDAQGGRVFTGIALRESA